MKTNLITIVAISFLSMIMLISCESHEQKTDAAFERVKEEKLVNECNIIAEKTEPIKKVQILDEWTKFKVETENKIHLNENKIKEIKGIPNVNAKWLKKAGNLEKENNDLRRQMDEYKEEVKVRWETFKLKINHDVNEIEIELKDMKIINKNK